MTACSWRSIPICHCIISEELNFLLVVFGIWDIVVGAVGQHLQLSLSRWPYTPTHGFLIGALLFGGASIQGTIFFTVPTFSQLVSFYDLMSFKGFWNWRKKCFPILQVDWNGSSAKVAITLMEMESLLNVEFNFSLVQFIYQLGPLFWLALRTGIKL